MSDLTTIYYDKLISIQLAKNPIYHAWTKDIEVHYHFIHECVLSGEVELLYVLIDRHIADIFTKPLGLDMRSQFARTAIKGYVLLNSLSATPMIGPEIQVTTSLHQASRFHLVASQLLGAARSIRQFHYQAPRLSIKARLS